MNGCNERWNHDDESKVPFWMEIIDLQCLSAFPIVSASGWVFRVIFGAQNMFPLIVTANWQDDDMQSSHVLMLVHAKTPPTMKKNKKFILKWWKIKDSRQWKIGNANGGVLWEQWGKKKEIILCYFRKMMQYQRFFLYFFIAYTHMHRSTGKL